MCVNDFIDTVKLSLSSYWAVRRGRRALGRRSRALVGDQTVRSHTEPLHVAVQGLGADCSSTWTDQDASWTRPGSPLWRLFRARPPGMRPRTHWCFINPIWPRNDPGPLEELKDADEEKDVWACCSQNLHRREQQKTDGWRILWTQSQILVQMSSGLSPHHHSRLHPSHRNQLLILWSELLTFMWNDPKTPETRTQSCCWMWSPDVVLSSVGSL